MPDDKNLIALKIQLNQEEKKLREFQEKKIRDENSFSRLKQKKLEARIRELESEIEGIEGLDLPTSFEDHNSSKDERLAIKKEELELLEEELFQASNNDSLMNESLLAQAPIDELKQKIAEEKSVLREMRLSNIYNLVLAQKLKEDESIDFSDKDIEQINRYLYTVNTEDLPTSLRDKILLLMREAEVKELQTLNRSFLEKIYAELEFKANNAIEAVPKFQKLFYKYFAQRNGKDGSKLAAVQNITQPAFTSLLERTLANATNYQEFITGFNSLSGYQLLNNSANSADLDINTFITEENFNELKLQAKKYTNSLDILQNTRQVPSEPVLDKKQLPQIKQHQQIIKNFHRFEQLKFSEQDRDSWKIAKDNMGYLKKVTQACKTAERELEEIIQQLQEQIDSLPSMHQTMRYIYQRKNVDSPRAQQDELDQLESFLSKLNNRHKAIRKKLNEAAQDLQAIKAIQRTIHGNPYAEEENEESAKGLLAQYEALSEKRAVILPASYMDIQDFESVEHFREAHEFKESKEHSSSSDNMVVEDEVLDDKPVYKQASSIPENHVRAFSKTYYAGGDEYPAQRVSFVYTPPTYTVEACQQSNRGQKKGKAYHTASGEKMEFFTIPESHELNNPAFLEAMMDAAIQYFLQGEPLSKGQVEKGVINRSKWNIRGGDIEQQKGFYMAAVLLSEAAGFPRKDIKVSNAPGFKPSSVMTFLGRKGDEFQRFEENQAIMAKLNSIRELRKQQKQSKTLNKESIAELRRLYTRPEIKAINEEMEERSDVQNPAPSA